MTNHRLSPEWPITATADSAVGWNNGSEPTADGVGAGSLVVVAVVVAAVAVVDAGGGGGDGAAVAAGSSVPRVDDRDGLDSRNRPVTWICGGNQSFTTRCCCCCFCCCPKYIC